MPPILFIKSVIVAATCIGCICYVAETAICAERSGQQCAPTSSSKSASVKDAITYKTVSISKHFKDSDWDFKYPQFSGTPVATVAALNKEVSKYMRDYKIDPHEERGNPDMKNTHSLEYKIERLPNVLTIVTTDSDFGGGAHGIYGSTTYNFLLQPFRRIDLRTALGPNIDLHALSDLCKIELYKTLQNSDESFVDSGTKSEVDSFSLFTFDQEGITFMFQPYQVAPYSEGMPEITLPWSRIKPLMSPSSPIYYLAKDAKPDTAVLSSKNRQEQMKSALAGFLKRVANPTQ